MIITDLAVFTYENGQLTLKELMQGATLEEVRSKTAARFIEKLK
jgi:3-oxoacid CoA-transferase